MPSFAFGNFLRTAMASRCAREWRIFSVFESMPTILCQRGLFLKTLGEIHGRKAVDEAKPGEKRRGFHNSGAAKCRQVPARRVSWGTEGSPRYHGSKPVELHKEWPRVVMRGPLAWRVLARSWGDR